METTQNESSKGVRPSDYRLAFDYDHGPDYIDANHRRWFPDGAWRETNGSWRGTNGNMVTTCEPSTDLKERQSSIIYYHRLVLTSFVKQFKKLRDGFLEDGKDPTDEDVKRMKELRVKAQSQEKFISKLMTEHERERNQPQIDQWTKQMNDIESKLQVNHVQLESARSKRDRDLIEELEHQEKWIESTLSTVLGNLDRLGAKVPKEYRQLLADYKNGMKKARDDENSRTTTNRGIIKRLEL